jgi:hypothetical protein
MMFGKVGSAALFVAFASMASTLVPTVDEDGCVTRAIELGPNYEPSWIVQCIDSCTDSDCGTMLVSSSAGPNTGTVCFCPDFVGPHLNCCRLVFVWSTESPESTGDCGTATCPGIQCHVQHLDSVYSAACSQ